MGAGAEYGGRGSFGFARIDKVLDAMLAVLEQERARAECQCCRTLAARLAEALKGER